MAQRLLQKLDGLITGLILISFGDAQTDKTKLCVEYRIQNSRWKRNILDVKENISESACLRRCARHPNCRAYNICRNTGTCELVHGMAHCAETEEQERCTYVNLASCSDLVPWNAKRRNWGEDLPCLIWQRYKAGDDCPHEALRSRDATECVALIPYKGLYLPGRYVYYRAFRSVSEQAQVLRCNRHGYLVRVDPACPTDWRRYKVGDDLPPGAVQVSSWTDDSPVYLISFKSNVGCKLGYYLVSRQQAFVMSDKAVHTPSEMTMLVHVWWGSSWLVMPSSNGNLLPFVRESTVHQWIPLPKDSNENLWYFLWFAPEETVEQTIETPMI